MSDTAKPENFLQDFVDLCGGTEIPPQFAVWSGLCGISCAMGRRCWIDMGTFHIFPNLYVVLVAGSGMMRKGTSIGMIKRILRTLEPRPNLISQKITPEALIDTLSKGDQANGKTLISSTSAGFVLLDELATFLNKSAYDAGMGALLTPLFDGEPVEYKTMGRGIQNIINPCLGILAAATYDWISASIPESAIGGGVTSRFIFVHEETVPDPVPFPDWSQFKLDLQERCLNALRRITTYEGEFKLNKEARSYYAEQYISFRKSRYGTDMFENRNLRGYASRRYVHQLKLGMLFSASERSDKVITETHLRASTAVLEQTEKSLGRLYALITSSEQGNLTTMVLDFIRSRGCVTKGELTRFVSHKVGVNELNMVIQTLVAQEYVQEVIDSKTVMYRYIGDDKIKP